MCSYQRDKETAAGALGCYVELQGVTREALVKGYAVWPDVFARIFLGSNLSNIARTPQSFHSRNSIMYKHNNAL